MRTLATSGIVTLILSGVMGSPIAAQSLGADGDQDLTFGEIWAGIPATVSWLDTKRAGQYVIRGTRRAEVLVQLTLPPAMVNPRGAQLPLEFGPNDGGHGVRPSVGQATSFDPRVPLTTRLGNSGRLYLFLGGTAQPATNQQAGSYTGTITLTVSYTGN